MDDPQSADADAELGGQRLEPKLVGARAEADHQAVAPGERVARLEVGADAVTADVRHREATAGEERSGRRGLHPALGVAHVGHHDVAGGGGDQGALGPLDDEAEVHGEDHVWSIRALLDDLHLAAGRADRGDQPVPLLAGQVRVGLPPEVHEGVDPVVDPEMVRTDHDVPTTPAERSAQLVDQLLDQLTRHHAPPSDDDRIDCQTI
jgi:hypothetical protein